MTILPLKRLRFSPPFSRQEALQPLAGEVQPELTVILSGMRRSSLPGEQSNESARQKLCG
jgi:hypothetical protein